MSKTSLYHPTFWITVHEYVPFSFDIAGSVRPTAVLLYSSRVGFLVSLFRVPDFILSFLFPLTFLIRVLREMHKHTHAHVLPLAFIIFLSISFKIFKQTNTSLLFKFITSVKAFFFKKNISSPGGVFVWWVLITIAIFFRLLFTVVQSFSFFSCVYALFVCVFAAFFNAKKRFDCYYKFLFVCLLFFFSFVYWKNLILFRILEKWKPTAAFWFTAHDNHSPLSLSLYIFVLWCPQPPPPPPSLPFDTITFAFTLGTWNVECSDRDI